MSVSFLGKNRTSIFFGAGLSIGSGLPTVGGENGLSRALLRAFELDEEEIGRIEGFKLPFEAIISCLRLGADPNEFLKIFDVATPNLAYISLALAAKAGCIDRFITTNFDQCLEASLSRIGVDFSVFVSIEDFLRPRIASGSRKVELIKLHGCISQPESLGITIEKVGRNLKHPNLDRCLNAIVRGQPTENLVFLGYSGSDHFDIVPSLRGLAIDKMLTRNIVFIDHFPLEFLTSDLPEFLSNFSGEMVKADTDKVIAASTGQFFLEEFSFDARYCWRDRFDLWVKNHVYSPSSISAGIFSAVAAHEASDEKLLLTEKQIETLDGLVTHKSNRIHALALGNRHDEAFELVSEVLTALPEIADQFTIAHAHFNIGVYLVHKDEFQSAIQHFERSIEMCLASSHGRSAELRFRVLANLSSALEKRGDFFRLAKLIAELDSEFHEIGDLSARVLILRTKASLCKSQGRHSAAIEILEEATLLCRRLSLRDFEIAALFDKANILRDLGRYEAAMLVDRECLSLSEEYEFTELKGVSFGNLASSAIGLKDFNLARHAFLKAREIATGNNLTNIEGNYGNFLMRTGDFREAELFLEGLVDSLAGRIDAFGRDQLRRALLNLSAVHLEMDDYSSASVEARKSADMATDLENVWGYIAALVNLAVAQYNNNDFAGAPGTAKRALNEIQKHRLDFSSSIPVLTRIAARGDY